MFNGTPTQNFPVITVSQTEREVNSPQKTMDKPCASAFSRKIELRTCNEIPQEERSKMK